MSQSSRLHKWKSVVGRRTVKSHTQVVSNVEPRRTRISDALEVRLALRQLSRIDDLALRQQHKLVKEGNNIAPRLMDGEDNGSVVVACE